MKRALEHIRPRQLCWPWPHVLGEIPKMRGGTNRGTDDDLTSDANYKVLGTWKRTGHALRVYLIPI